MWIFFSLLYLTLISNKPIDNLNLIATSGKFEFYSNFWINMHHFLYQKASESKKELSITLQENENLSKLSENELETMNQALEFYKRNVITNDLLFNRNLSKIKLKLSNTIEDQLEEVGENTELFKILNQFHDVYKAHLWKLHDSANRKKVKENLKLINQLEKKVITKIADLAHSEEYSAKMRVDVSAYANWAGAYTTTYPFIHIIISSTRKNLEGTQWIETIFHEASHYLIDSNEGFIATTIKETAEKLKITVPERLWHHILFYFAGTVTRNELMNLGIEHEKYMIVNNLAADMHDRLSFLDLYISGELNFPKTIEKVLQ